MVSGVLRFRSAVGFAVVVGGGEVDRAGLLDGEVRGAGRVEEDGRRARVEGVEEEGGWIFRMMAGGGGTYSSSSRSAASTDSKLPPAADLLLDLDASNRLDTEAWYESYFALASAGR